MLDKLLFWVVLGWMIAMLLMVIQVVREAWLEAGQLGLEDDLPATSPAQEPKAKAASDLP